MTKLTTEEVVHSGIELSYAMTKMCTDWMNEMRQKTDQPHDVVSGALMASFCHTCAICMAVHVPFQDAEIGFRRAWYNIQQDCDS